MSDPFLSSLLGFLLTCTIIELTPGPNMAYLATLSLANGWRAGLAAVAGIAIGLSVYGVAAALGLAALIDQSPLLYETLRWGGVIYLFWLAWDAWTTETEIAPEQAGSDVGTMRTAFRRGLVTNLLNPKAGIFYVAVVPSFVVSAGHVMTQTLVLTGVFAAVATIIHTAIVLLASRLHDLVSDPSRRRPARRIMAIVLAAIAIWFAWSTRR